MNNIDKLQKSINQLEEIVSNLVEERNALQAENKKLKEQQLTEEEIVKVMSGAFDDSITWRHIPFADDFPYEDVMTKLNKELAKAIIKAREEKQTRTCDPECPFCKTEEASK